MINFKVKGEFGLVEALNLKKTFINKVEPCYNIDLSEVTELSFDAVGILILLKDAVEKDPNGAILRYTGISLEVSRYLESAGIPHLIQNINCPLPIPIVDVKVKDPIDYSKEFKDCPYQKAETSTNPARILFCGATALLTMFISAAIIGFILGLTETL